MLWVYRLRLHASLGQVGEPDIPPGSLYAHARAYLRARACVLVHARAS